MTDDVTAQSLYKCTPRQARSAIQDCIEVGLVPYVQSSPGMGKSSIVNDIGKGFNLKVLDERLSTRSPVDLAGIPDFVERDGQRVATFTPFDVYPLDTTPLPAGKDGWLLFLDEFNAASKATQAAAYKLVLDKKSGLRDLHPNTAIVCAGNLSTDRAITNPLSTAMQSRVVHIEMVLSHQEWLEDVALARNYDPRIIAFLNYQSGFLMDFKPNHNEKTFCCPRTWEFMNKLVKDKEVTDAKTSLYAGTITSGVAVDFVTFTKVYLNMPNIKQILSDPAGMFVPADPPTKWAVISHLMDKVDAANFADISIYVNRFTAEFRVLFFRSIIARQPKLRTHPEFAKAMSELSRYFNGQ
jgi:hypothetical protein